MVILFFYNYSMSLVYCCDYEDEFAVNDDFNSDKLTTDLKFVKQITGPQFLRPKNYAKNA